MHASLLTVPFVPFQFHSDVAYHFLCIHNICRLSQRHCHIKDSNFTRAHFTHLFRQIHFNGLSVSHRHKMLRNWKRAAERRPNHVRGMSKQTEQEVLAGSSTIGPPICCNGYLALAAAAKATSNGPPLQTGSFRIGSSTIMRPRLSHERGLACIILRNMQSLWTPLCAENHAVLQFTVWLQMMENYWFMNGREAFWKRLMGWCLSLSSPCLCFPLTSS